MSITVHETPAPPKPGDIIGPGATVLEYHHLRDGTQSTFAYGTALCLWRGEFVIWSQVVFRDEDETRGGHRWLCESGSYHATVETAAAEWNQRLGRTR